MATYYIAPATHPTTPGNDTTGNGSSVTPWATISKAHTSAASGDTIICKDGTYTWTVQTFSKNLTVRAENNGLAIFDGAAATGIYWLFDSNFTITGLTFQNATVNTGQYSGFSSSRTVASNLTINLNNCTFRSSVIVGNNNFLGLIGSADTAAFSGFVWNINTCLFDNVDGPAGNYGLFCKRSHAESFNVINSVIYLNSSGLNYICCSGFGFALTISFVNTIVKNDTGGTVTLGVVFNGGTISSSASTSCFHTITSSPSGTGVITSDPLFVDAASGVFDLRPTSPCLGTGTLV